MKGFIVGLIAGVALVPAALYYYMRSGRAPVATSEPPMPFEKTLAKSALHARLQQEAPRTVPIKADEINLLAGARIYKDDCAMCHGLPDQPAPAAAQGMFPPPPQLFRPKGMVTDDPVGVTFWKAKNGIRLTGMPGFHASLSDEQLWQVSLVLAQADKLPESVRRELVAKPTGPEQTK